MNDKINKCSLSEHKEEKAIYYCRNCNDISFIQIHT